MSELIDIPGNVLDETELAYLFDEGGPARIHHKAAVWLPKSHCDWDEDSGTMAIPEWLAEREGLI